MNEKSSRAVASRRTKVLHLITRLAHGGAQDNTLLTCELHDGARYEVHLASYPEGGLMDRALAACEGRFHALNHLVHPIHPLRDILAVWELVRLFRRERFDIVHGHSSKAGFLGRVAALLTGTPFVFTYHGFAFHDFMPAWKRWGYVLLERLVRRGARYYVTLSERDRQLAIRLRMVRPDQSATIYTGIDMVRVDGILATPPADPLALEEIPNTGKRIVFVGRLDAQKAPVSMVEAFAEVVSRHPDAHLVMVGDGELKSDVLRRIADLGLTGHAHVLGYRTDALAIVKHCDVFAFSSLWEAMGRAMVEAMLLGKPVVVPPIYGIPEIVEHGVTGYHYDVGNMQQLASQVCRCFDEPGQAQVVGAAAQRRVRPLFGARDMVTRIERVYEQVLATVPAAS